MKSCNKNILVTTRGSDLRISYLFSPTLSAYSPILPSKLPTMAFIKAKQGIHLYHNIIYMKDYHNYKERWEARRGRHRGTFGFILLIIGLVILANHLGFFYLQYHILWPVILIALGLFIGIRNKFSNNAPYILIGIGVFNLIPRFEIWGVESTELVLPLALVGIGLLFILRPRKRYCPPAWKDNSGIVASTNPEDILNIDVAFGGRKAVVTSKQFKGGTVNVAFSGAEINLMQADSTEPMILDLKVSFGGVEIIVPSHWEVQIDMQPTFGNVEDNRMMRTPAAGETKRTLILRGTCSFGNVELKSY